MLPNNTIRYLLPQTPAIPGVIKQRPEDFLVEELPLYEPSGEGEHLMLMIEKTNLSTSDALRIIARLAQVSRGAVGYAGMKDKNAITRQHVSIHLPGGKNDTDAAVLSKFTRDDLKVIWAMRHNNKLRPGHLAGNRFVIRARNTRPTDVIHAKRALDLLAARGVPNYFGPQRFGRNGLNAALGKLLLKADYKGFLDLLLGPVATNDNTADDPIGSATVNPETNPDIDPTSQQETGSPTSRAESEIRAREAYAQADYAAALVHLPRHLRHERQTLDHLRQGKSAERAVMAIDRLQRDFYLSALQSDIFNRTLSLRLDDGSFDKLLPGDIAFIHGNRALFAVDEATAEIENAPEGRVPKMEVSPSGPMWGPKTLRCSGKPGEIDSQALAQIGLTLQDIPQDCSAGQLTGERRPLRVAISNVQIGAGVDEYGAFIRYTFDLPRSGYATTVLDQVMKSSFEESQAEE